jgi:hypothetical protein
MSFKRSAALLLAAAAFTTGCVGYRVTPDKPASMPRAEKQTPLRVGVSLKQSFEWKGVGMDNRAMDRWRTWSRFKPMFYEVDHMGDAFVKALDESHGFSSVYILPGNSFGPAELASHDIVIDAQIKGGYQQDPAMMGKAFMTGFLLLLPAPFVRYDDGFTASGELSLYDSSGRLLRRLSDSQSVTASAALFSAGQPSEIMAGIQSAAQNLAVKLVNAILADRETLEAAARRGAGVAKRKQPEVDPEVAAAVAAAEAAAKAAAAAAARVAQLQAQRNGAPSPAAAPEPPAASAVSAAEPAAAAAEAAVAAPQDEELTAGPARPSGPKHGRKIRVTDAEAAAELLP